MPLNNDTLLSHLETIVNKRNDIINSTLTDEEKLASLSVLDKENDELNQSIDIYYRLVDYQGFLQYQELLETKVNISDLPDFKKYAKKTDLPDLTPYAKTSALPNLTPYAKISALPNLTPYAKKTDLPDFTLYAKTSALPNLTPYAKKTDLPDFTLYAKTSALPSLAPYAKKADLPDLTPFKIPMTLFNGWSNYGSPYSELTSFRVGSVVHVSGLVKGGVCTPGTLLCILHPSFRPPSRLVFVCNSSNAFARVDVRSDGYILIRYNCHPSSLSLNFSFVIE